MKTITCRAHGGTFTVESVRGRPPVSCGGPNDECDAYPVEAGDGLDDMSVIELKKLALDEGYSTITRLGKKASLIDAIRIQRQKNAKSMRTEEIHAALEAEPVPPTPAPNSTLAMAKTAKERLVPLGWLCKGRGWAEDGVLHAELLCTRGEEMLLMHWAAGALVSQSYSLWQTTKPEVNGKPRSSLSFDPGELTDQELIRRLAGMPVVWWNSLGQNEMKGIISGTKIQIEHAYDGKGNELPGDRMVKFNDQADGGFRAFRVAALLKVG